LRLLAESDPAESIATARPLWSEGIAIKGRGSRRLLTLFKRLKDKRRGSKIRNKNIRVGRHTYGVGRENAFRATTQSPLTIGSFCSVADGVLFLCHAGGHDLKAASVFPIHRVLLDDRSRDLPHGKAGIAVGNDVWIGRDAMVLPGVRIGHGAVIGAGSVVTKDVPPYAIVAGNPARLIRKRTSDHHIAHMLAIGWWDWSDERIRSEAEILAGPIEDFVERHIGATGD
jgi:virginiamycin A acetyltransferase